MKCAHCGVEVVEGTGVDHELNENETIVFCSMDAFKEWIDFAMELQRMVLNGESAMTPVGLLTSEGGDYIGKLEH